MNKTKEAYDEAIEVLKRTSTKHGFFAAYPGYDAVWARDSMIISLGASLIDKKFQNTFKQSIITLAKNQSHLGQIPNAVDKFSKRKHHVDYKSIDSSLWFIIGNYIYAKRYKDNSLLKKYKKQIEKAQLWISYQDTGEDLMPEQQPTSDWFDAFPHRYGHTINTEALYYKSLILLGKTKEAKKIKEVVNKSKDDGLWNGNYYVSWRWKNHNKYKEIGDWFESLGNLMTIVFDLADKKQSEKILSYIKKNKIDQPYPIKTLYPAIKPKGKDWHDYFYDAGATPYHYSNAGIWTYIGGFYVLALIKQKKFKEAEKALEKIAEANLKKPMFSEWLNGHTGEPSGGGGQGWNAGMYILAYESLKEKKVLL
ncbi:hypothetical protein COU53_03490 [Candidatus Pacearchaeota archaeon CG10_big_fil_rev_8_21_14_0_10_30_48]|nr:MAG: hypothetical protein COU53_03490 [Candidatus Pacearchaeota archaeon CG10_big_fil_rev_8_21_14_0_10_30_48]